MRKPHPVQVIISGGQTGADQGALMAARELGLATGGAAPHGWLTENGPQEEMLRAFGLVECLEKGYPVRTKSNVLTADGTLIVGAHRRGGSALTVRIAREHGKPLFHLPYSGPVDAAPPDDRIEEFQRWLKERQIRVLNVAGNRESQSPGIGDATRRFLVRALWAERGRRIH